MTKITLSIEGMMCCKCSGHMDDAINREFKVKKVSSSHEAKESVIITEEDISDSKLREVVETAGYELKGIKREPYKKGLFSVFKR